MVIPCPTLVDNKLAETPHVQGGLVDAPEDVLEHAPGNALEDAPEGAQDGIVDDHWARAVLVARNTLFSKIS